MTPKQSEQFARDWADAWNRRDLEAVLAHFADEVIFSSPTALAVVGSPTIHGKDELRRYWTAALARLQSLEFHVVRVLWDDAHDELSIVYDREVNGRHERAVEMLGFDREHRVVRGEVLYGVIPTDGESTRS